MTLPLLQAYLTYARNVQVGAQSGVEECKRQFAWDRWNCPDSATQLKGLRRGTLAFLNTNLSLSSGSQMTKEKHIYAQNE